MVALWSGEEAMDLWFDSTVQCFKRENKANHNGSWLLSIASVMNLFYVKESEVCE